MTQPLGPVDPDAIVSVNGEDMKIKDIKNLGLRAMFGLGHMPWHIESREVYPDGRPYSPQDCLVADDPTGEWINGGSNLVCRGCGIDCT